MEKPPFSDFRWQIIAVAFFAVVVGGTVFVARYIGPTDNASLTAQVGSITFPTDIGSFNCDVADYTVTEPVPYVQYRHGDTNTITAPVYSAKGVTFYQTVNGLRDKLMGIAKFSSTPGIDIANDTITISGLDSSVFATGKPVRYGAGTSTPIGGLVTNNYYWLNVNGSTVTLHNNRADSLTGANKVNLITIGSGTSHQLNRGCATRDGVRFTPVTAFNLTTDVITVPSHGLVQGERLAYNTGGNTVPNGLRPEGNGGDAYYVHVLSSDTFTLHLSEADANANTNRVDIKGYGTGGAQEVHALYKPRQSYPVRIFPENMCLSGARFIGDQNLSQDITNYLDTDGNYCNAAGGLFESLKGTYEGIRAYDLWDGMRVGHASCDTASPADCNVTIRDSWITDIRDDAIEADSIPTLTVEDVLIERAFSGISLTGINSTGIDHSTADPLTLHHFYVQLTPYPHYGAARNIAPLKIYPRAGKWECDDCVFAFEWYDNAYARSHWINLWSKLKANDPTTSCKDVYLLYTGGTTLPSNFPTVPSCVKVKTGQEAIDHWNAVRENWISRHPDIDRIEGVDPDPDSDPVIHPPTVSFSATPTSVQQGGQVQITWSSHNATSCTGTNFSTNSSTAGTATETPAQTTEYSLTCQGSGGTASSSSIVSVIPTDTTPPTVSIGTPATGSVVAVKSTILISAVAFDASGVQKVEFYVNGVLTCTDTVENYSCSWKVPNAKKKAYSLTARAYDNKGNSALSAPITITAN